MFGVVVCPRCSRAKGVRLGGRSSACQCGNVIDLRHARVYHRTDDARELAKAVGLVNAKLRGGFREYEKVAPPRRARGVHGRVADAAVTAGNRDKKVKAAAIGLTKELGTFTRQDLATVLHALGIADVQACIEKLLASNAIYEPTPGRFKAI